MIIENAANILAWSLLGLAICLALIVTLMTYWLTR
jgi:hypothetical protein